jgi:hypothetical protein
MTSQNIDLSSWDSLSVRACVRVCVRRGGQAQGLNITLYESWWNTAAGMYIKITEIMEFNLFQKAIMYIIPSFSSHAE